MTPKQAESGAGQKRVGQLFIFIGIVAVIFAAMYDVSLPNEEFQKIQQSLGNTAPQGEFKTVNLQRMQFQLLYYLSGIASCVCGVIMVVGGNILDSLSAIYHADRSE